MTGKLLLTAVFFCGAVGIADAQDAPVSLFGIAIGSPFKPSKDYIFVQEERDTLYYSRHKVSNPEYLLQGVAISKSSHVVVKVDGRTATGTASKCERMLAETVAQLNSRYPRLKERIGDVDGTSWHLLSMDRRGCAFNESVGGMSLHLACSSSFLLRCERLSNSFVIEAADTEYTKLARDEAKATARSPGGNHLD
jgi:hypothetical protein